MPDLANLHVDGSEDFCFRAQLQFQWRIGELSGAQDNASLTQSANPSAEDAAAMFYRQNGARAVLRHQLVGGNAGVNSGDTSRQHVRKSVSIARADLQIAERRGCAARERVERPDQLSGKPTTQRSDFRSERCDGGLFEPGNSDAWVVHVRVQFGRVVSRPEGLKTGCIVEGESKDQHPLGQSVIGQHTQGVQLMNAGSERRTAQGIVEVRRNTEQRIAGKANPGLTGQLGERKSTRGQERTRDCDKLGLPASKGRGHGSPSAGQNEPIWLEKNNLAAIADIAACPESETQIRGRRKSVSTVVIVL